MSKRTYGKNYEGGGHLVAGLLPESCSLAWKGGELGVVAQRIITSAYWRVDRGLPLSLPLFGVSLMDKDMSIFSFLQSQLQ